MTTEETEIKLPVSRLTKKQVRTYGPKIVMWYGRKATLTAEVRHDDECGNGHNSFAITGDVSIHGRVECCGCMHEEIVKFFPQLAPYIRWHLSSTDGPMHYVANGKYWAGHCGWRDGKPDSPPNLEHLKSTIVYGVLPTDAEFDLADHIYSDARGFSWNEARAHSLEAWLMTRLEAMMAAFKLDVESLGLTY